MVRGDILWTAIFPTRPVFLHGAVRVRGLEGGGIKVRILESSATSSQFSGPIISSHVVRHDDVIKKKNLCILSRA